MEILRHVWGELAMVVIVAAITALFAVRRAHRSSRMRRFALQRDFTYTAADPAAIALWKGRPSEEMGASNPWAANVVRGVHGGRPVTNFDFRCDVNPTALAPTVSVHAGTLFFAGGRARTIAMAEGTYSVVVVECRMPPGANTAAARRGFAPWRVRIDPETTVAWIDRLVPPAELAAVLDEVTALLDLVVTSAPRS